MGCPLNLNGMSLELEWDVPEVEWDAGGAKEVRSKCLAIFLSMSKLFNKNQKHDVISDLDQLAVNARKTWNNFPIEVLTKAWATKTNVLKAIIAKGGNEFKLPHAKDMEDFDWEAM